MKITNKRWMLLRRFVVVMLLALTTMLANQTTPVKAQCGDSIEPGVWVYGEIAYGRPCSYTFYGRVGTYVSIRMEKESFSSPLDPYLELKDPYGYIVAFDDDSGGNHNSLIGSYRLTSSGWYTIIARSYQNSTSGRFGLYLENY